MDNIAARSLSLLEWKRDRSMHLNPPFDRITIETGKMGGQPCIRGMRITVRRVLDVLATYTDRRQFVRGLS